MPNDALERLYHNLATSATTLGPVLQRRIHRHSVARKDDVLAAALARRGDTLTELDDLLGAHRSAKVAAAWLTRPGRSSTVIAARLDRERRVSVVEAVAKTADLDPAVYATCAAALSPRVAHALLANPSVDVHVASTCAQYLATVDGIDSSNERVADLLRERCDVVREAYLQAAHDVEMLCRVDGGPWSTATAQHVLDTCAASVDAVFCRGADQPRSKQARPDAHDLYRAIRYVATAVQRHVPVGLCNQLDTSAIIAVTTTAIACAGRIGAYTGDSIRRECSVIRNHLDGDADGAALAARIAAATTTAALAKILAPIEQADGFLPVTAALAVLHHPAVDADVVGTLISLSRWDDDGILGLVEAHRDRLDPAVVAIILHETYSYDDDELERYAPGGNVGCLWRALVQYSAAHDPSTAAHLFHSAHADGAAIETLPFAVFCDNLLPGWVYDAVQTYLDTHLTTTAALDGFELLAASHHGSLDQVVRGAVRATRRQRNNP